MKNIISSAQTMYVLTKWSEHNQSSHSARLVDLSSSLNFTNVDKF